MKAVVVFLAAAAVLGAAAAEPVVRLEYSGPRNVLYLDGRRTTFAECLSAQIARHPAMRRNDVLKLCFQAAYGPAHARSDAAAAKCAFDAEFAAVPARDNALFEIVSPDFCRIDLGAWKYRKLPPEWLFNMFIASADEMPDGDEFFRRCLDTAKRLIPELVGGGDIPHRAPHHSAEYRKAEKPSYRIVSTRFIHTLPVLKRAAELTARPVAVIAVDGRAASGKTTLARQLAAILDAGAVHMDDFFLPPDLRTAQRYDEPGGNVHYERFAAEVLPVLKRPGAFRYRVFDCSTMDYGIWRDVKSSRWRIVEGAYALHPRFGEYADLKVFFDIAPEEQMRRIRKRNGAERAQIFARRWIPLEEKYLKRCKIQQRADIVIDR